MIRQITLQLKPYKYLPLILLFIISSCKVNLIATYNAEVSAEIQALAKTVDRFYLNMLDNTYEADNGRAFNNFTNDYVNIQVDLNALYLKNKIRPLNENSTKICKTTLDLFKKYKEEHKTKNTLSDGLIKLNRKTFSDLFYAMQVAEEAKKIISDSPTNN